MTRDYHFFSVRTVSYFCNGYIAHNAVIAMQDVSSELAGSDFRSEGLGDDKQHERPSHYIIYSSHIFSITPTTTMILKR